MNKSIILATGLLDCTHICSVNEIYEANIKRKHFKCKCGQKYFTDVYYGKRLSDAAANYKKELKRSLQKECPNRLIYDREYAMILSFIFIVNKNIEKRDEDNFEKLTIDAIYEHFGINDSNVYEKHTMKAQADTSREFVKFTIEQSPRKKSEYKFRVK